MAEMECPHPRSVRTTIALGVDHSGGYCNGCNSIIPSEPPAEQLEIAFEADHSARHTRSDNVVSLHARRLERDPYAAHLAQARAILERCGDSLAGIRSRLRALESPDTSTSP